MLKCLEFRTKGYAESLDLVKCWLISNQQGFEDSLESRLSRDSDWRVYMNMKKLFRSKKIEHILLALVIVLLPFSLISGVYLFQNLSKISLPDLPKIGSLTKNLPRVYIVQSGSMEPAIKVGGLILSIPAKSYAHGDIITFKINPSDKKLVTHRLVAAVYTNGDLDNPTYLTSGDANEEIDNWRIHRDNIVGKVVLTAPYLGYIADYAKKPYGFLLFVIVPATIIIYEEVKMLLKEIINLIRKIKLPKINFNSRKTKINLKDIQKTAALVPLIGLIFILSSVSTSFYLDKEESKGNVFSASSNFEETTPTPTPSEIPPEKITICHAAGKAGEQANYTTLTLPWNAVYGNGGHFNEDGTPQAGHEEDYLGECIP